MTLVHEGEHEEALTRVPPVAQWTINGSRYPESHGEKGLERHRVLDSPSKDKDL